ncbi:hypothetical protein V2G26_018074 [Clonostachys chloroleuca]
MGPQPRPTLQRKHAPTVKLLASILNAALKTPSVQQTNTFDYAQMFSHAKAAYPKAVKERISKRETGLYSRCFMIQRYQEGAGARLQEFREYSGGWAVSRNWARRNHDNTRVYI